MTMMAYRCENRKCHVIHFRSSPATAKCPSCKKEGGYTGMVSRKKV